MARTKRLIKRSAAGYPRAGKLASKTKKRSALMADRDALPRWDKELRQLWFGDTLVKQFRHPAKVAELILNAFQEQHWRSRIDDPLPPVDRRTEARRLRNELHSLNGRLDHSVIRFYMDGTGKGIRWEKT